MPSSDLEEHQRQESSLTGNPHNPAPHDVSTFGVSACGYPAAVACVEMFMNSACKGDVSRPKGIGLGPSLNRECPRPVLVQARRPFQVSSLAH